MSEPKMCLLTTVKSDSHSWNQVYMQYVLEKHGYVVENLGSCPSMADTISAIEIFESELVVVLSVNGHGFVQGQELLGSARKRLGNRCPEFVIDGQLTTKEKNNTEITSSLESAGYEAVFSGPDAIGDFKQFLTRRHHDEHYAYASVESFLES